MVCNPDPPKEIAERMSAPSEIIAVESDESDEDLGNAPPGYALLPQGPTQGLSSDEEDMSETEDADNLVSNSTPPVDDNASTSTASGRRCSDVQEVDRLYSSPVLRPELNVDCDQVRAAMSGFTLPASATPAWAVDVPESQLSALLTQQIHRLQASHNNTSSTT